MIQITPGVAKFILEAAELFYTESQGDYDMEDELLLLREIHKLYPNMLAKYSFVPAVKEIIG